MKIAVIGGGAAGFFAAINLAENYPEAQIVILEKSKKVLSKVKVSGGGRCNVTNGETSIKKLTEAYPRGGKALKKAFRVFNTKHCQAWFESRGVKLLTQADNCVFPVSQDAQSIIDVFMDEIRRLKVTLVRNSSVSRLIPRPNGIEISFVDENIDTQVYDKVIVATGGSPRLKGLAWLAELGHHIENPVPSLFTFNMPSEPIRKLMGVVVEETITSIQGTKLRSNGPLLITHWGMSGPSILKLSAFGARVLSDNNYHFKVQVNWVNEINNDLVLEELKTIVQEHGKKIITNIRPYYIPDRLWLFLVDKMGIEKTKRWNELGKKGLNKIVHILTNDSYEVRGKTTFKEEFVTCGGLSLLDIDMKTMQSKIVPNLYFAGEVMDIDGITGGYNFQAAWTTSFIAAKLN